MDRLKLWFPYLMLTGIVAVIVATNIGGPAGADVAAMKTVCAPCGVTVDAASALVETVEKQKYYFCSDKCRDGFVGGDHTAALGEHHQRIDIELDDAIRVAFHQGRNGHHRVGCGTQIGARRSSESVEKRCRFEPGERPDHAVLVQRQKQRSAVL